MNILGEAKRVFDSEIDAIEKLRDSLNGEFEEVCEMICNCEGKVIVTGMGKQELVCKQWCQHLDRRLHQRSLC